MTQRDDPAATFDAERPRLIRIAYRMLGSVADAEDVAQDAFIRWHEADRAAVRDARAFLTRIVTRLCLDQLKSARRRRETYVGPWLPEPLVESIEDAVDEDVTLPLMMALERLSPLERAAFLLHDVFGLGFEEIGESIGRDAAACRQLASRARKNVRAGRPRFDLPKERGIDIAAAFFAATRSGDMTALRALLADDVASYADGGGVKPAAMKPSFGREDVVRLWSSVAKIFAADMSRLVRYCLIDGLPGFITIEQGGVLQTTALEIEDGRIAGIYIMRNPEKLRHVAGASPN